MHRAVGGHPSRKISNYLMGLSRNPWIHLSDSAGTFMQGMSCAKNTPCRVKTKYFYPMESVVFKASIPVSRSNNPGSNAEMRIILASASLQSRGNAKGKLVDRASASGRYLLSKRLMESAFQVLRDLRNENFTMGLFRLGRSGPSVSNLLSSHAREHSAEAEFEWSSALWEAEVSNAAVDKLLSESCPVHAEINAADGPQHITNGTDAGFRVATSMVDDSRDTTLCNAVEAESIDRTTTAVACVNLKPSDLCVHDTHDFMAQGNGILKEDVVEESRNISDHHSKNSEIPNFTDIENQVKEAVQSSGCEPSEDGVQADLKESSEELSMQSDLRAIVQIGESEMREKIERLEKLREAVAHHAYRYNTLNAAIISDSAYDALVKEMEQIEAVGFHHSRPFMVGAPPSPALLKVQHTVPMLSLASVQKEEELLSWHQRLQQRLGTDQNSVQWVLEPKVDGLALSLLYENGRLVCASTRGNGFEGEDVTHNAKNVQNIPLVIPQERQGSDTSLSSLEVRGEIYMPLIEFEELNAAKLKSGERPFANPRNAAAGSMRLLSSEKLDHRPLSFVAYSVANIAWRDSSESCPSTPSNQWEALQLLKSLGFFVNEDNQIFDSFNSALEYAKSWMNKRRSLGYEADGIVFKVNDQATQASLGSVGGDPRWAVAWKFAATEVVTVLEAIELTVGRTGVIVPNARLKPVELGGVSIRRATLHNFKHVKNLGLCEGDHVIVQRAGDVIPQVVQPLEELRLSGAHQWVPPTQCPSCGSELKEDPSRAMVLCRNSDCSSRRSRQVEHFAKSLINGLGRKILSQLQEEGLVVDVADLYSLNEETVSNLPRFGKKSARKLLTAIEESKGKPDWEFIAALGIPRVGLGISQRLDKHLGGLRGLLYASDDDLLNVPDVGEQTLKALLDWCRCETNAGLVSELLAAGCARASSELSSREKQVPNSTETAVSFDSAEHESATEQQLKTAVERVASDENTEERRTAADAIVVTQPKLLGKIVVITGNFGLHDREYMHELVRSHGGKVRTSVTSKTSFVLAGANPGPNKIAACKQLGVDVVDWETFQAFLQHP